jgi:hypothetical protein
VAGSSRQAAAHVILYGVLTTVLLTPSLIFVERYAGLRHYLSDGIALSASEAERTELAWPVFSAVGEGGAPLDWQSWLMEPVNAETWLYYLMLATPFATLAYWKRAGMDGRQTWMAPAALSIGALFLVTHWFLLRGNLAARLGEVAPLWAVLGAIWLGDVARRVPGAPAWARRLRVVGVAILVVATGVCVAVIGEVPGQLRTAGMFRTEQTVWEQSVSVWQELGDLPRAVWSDQDATRGTYVAQYVNRCTDPAERVLVESYQPEVLALADRRFAGGRLNYVPDLLTDEAHQQEIVEYLRRQRVRLALVEDRYQAVFQADLPIVQAFLREHYLPVGVIPRDAEGRFRVFVRRDAQSRSTFGPDALPCFRDTDAPAQ